MNWYLKHQLKILLFPVILSFASCNNPSDLGRQIQQTNPLGTVILVDTLDVQTSNLLLDSLCIDPLEFFYNNTGASSPTRFNLLVGNYSNSDFAQVTSSAYVQFGGYSSIPTLDNSYSCDSIKVTMMYNYTYVNGYFPYSIYGSTLAKYTKEYTCGDTTTLHNFRFYEPSTNLSTSITAPTTKSPIDTTNLLGTKYFYPYQTLSTSLGSNMVSAKLNKSLGDRLFANIISNPSDVYSNFGNYFNGLIVAPSAINTSMLGFASRDASNGALGPFLTIYYSNAISGGTTTGSILFKAPNYGFVYNSISANRAPVLASLVNPYDSISTDLTGNYCYLQAGSGLAVKTILPNFLSFVNSSPDKLAITNAFLVIKRSALKNNNDGGLDNKIPPPYLTLYALGTDGKPYKYSTTNQWQTITTDRTSVNPIRALYDYATQSYTLDLTNYLQNQALKNQTPQFIITAGFNNQLVNTLVFGDAKSQDNPIKLKVYYSRVKL